MHLENVVKSWDNVVCPAYRYVMSAETSLSFIVTGWHNLCGLQDDITVALKLYIVPYLKTGTLSFLYMCCVTSTVSTIIIMIIITLNWTTSMEELLAFLVLFMSYHEGCWLLFAWNSVILSDASIAVSLGICTTERWLSENFCTLESYGQWLNMLILLKIHSQEYSDTCCHQKWWYIALKLQLK